MCFYQDETLSERLWGLTEMFPKSLRTVAGFTYATTVYGTKGLYKVLSVELILFTHITYGSQLFVLLFYVNLKVKRDLNVEKFNYFFK